MNNTYITIAICIIAGLLTGFVLGYTYFRSVVLKKRAKILLKMPNWKPKI